MGSAMHTGSYAVQRYVMNTAWCKSAVYLVCCSGCLTADLLRRTLTVPQTCFVLQEVQLAHMSLDNHQQQPGSCFGMGLYIRWKKGWPPLQGGMQCW